MSEMQIQAVLAQMRQVSTQAGVQNTNGTPLAGPGAAATTGASGPAQPAAFAEALRDSLRSVNAVQQESNQLQTRFELGDEQVSLPQVMVAMNRASIAFEATNQVRNRLLSAYQEVMRMQV
ncbi:MAG: flagellar hook-basal body complex protein FliE [Thioalkalivibrionaceae bacterium]